MNQKDVYPNHLKNWNLDDAKAPGLNDRKAVHISNIDHFTIVQSRELSRSPKSNSSGGLGIKCKRSLYLGLDAKRASKDVYHLPLIKIVPRTFNVVGYDQISHILFTSRSAVSIFLNQYSLSGKKLIAIGPGTAKRLQDFGYQADYISSVATAEGVITLLEQLSIPSLLFPHAAKARSLLPNFLKAKGYLAIPIYDTECVMYSSLPSLDQFEEIIFTSPSTVEAFIKNYGKLPLKIQLTSIGPITKKAIELAVKNQIQ